MVLLSYYPKKIDFIDPNAIPVSFKKYLKNSDRP